MKSLGLASDLSSCVGLRKIVAGSLSKSGLQVVDLALQSVDGLVSLLQLYLQFLVHHGQFIYPASNKSKHQWMFSYNIAQSFRAFSYEDSKYRMTYLAFSS